MSLSLRELFNATKLTRNGRLLDATRLIQSILGQVDGAQKKELQLNEPLEGNPTPGTWSPKLSIVESAPISNDPGEKATQASTFTRHTLQFGILSYTYRLFTPSLTVDTTVQNASIPLVIMLHGCTQDSADFAHGTAMNVLAERETCLVVYPEQLPKANNMRCWNWFEPAHQKRDAGEPGMIVHLVRHLVSAHNADPARVYVAGLSAGGAMASLVAGLYPEVFAGVGVHSGLPSGAADSLMAAMSAMRRGSQNVSGKQSISCTEAAMTPTIVIHGSADKTVHPQNANLVVNAALAAAAQAGIRLERQESVAESPMNPAATKQYVRTVFVDASGKSLIEQWTVAGGPHAWSGGTKQGTFTDSDGPNASHAMLQFFLKHKK